MYTSIIYIKKLIAYRGEEQQCVCSVLQVVKLTCLHALRCGRLDWNTDTELDTELALTSAFTKVEAVSTCSQCYQNTAFIL